MNIKQSTVLFNEAAEMVLANVAAVSTEQLPIADTLNRVLSEDIFSDIDIPPFDVSAMDGYACNTADGKGPFRVIETIAAGAMPNSTIYPGQCSRIMTGAPLPKGADAVVKFEDTSFDKQRCVMHISENSLRSNVRLRGEDLRKDTIALQRGTLIRSAQIGVLAAVGKSMIPVYRKPDVGIIITGDELIEPPETPDYGQIRNINGWQMIAQLCETGCNPVYFGIVKDIPEMLESVIRNALQKCDVILISGGVSMGDFDFVPEILKKIGITILFDSIAVKPGKPTMFGTYGSKAVFCMPGNPVSAYVIFEMLVKPFLYKIAGNNYNRIKLQYKLSEDFTRHDVSRMEFRPVRFISRETLELCRYHGAAHIHAYMFADGVVLIPKGVDSIKAGDFVEIILL